MKNFLLGIVTAVGGMILCSEYYDKGYRAGVSAMDRKMNSKPKVDVKTESK